MGALNNETRDFRPQLDNELEAKKRLLPEDEGLSAVASASVAWGLVDALLRQGTPEELL